MKLMLNGLNGWARMERPRSEELTLIDAAITISGTLLVAATFALLHR